MTDLFASRTMFVKKYSKFREVIVSIERPKKGEDGLFHCKVLFSIGGKYDSTISGIDEINALDCSILYIKGIIEESIDPKFYWDFDEED